MIKIKFLLYISIISWLFFSCSTGQNLYRKSVLENGIDFDVKIVRSSNNPEVTKILETAYGRDFKYRDLEKSVYDAIEKYPDNGYLQEVAAFIQLLNSDNRKFFLHLVKAASDLENDKTEVYLRIINSIALTYHEAEIFINLLENLVVSHDHFRVRNLARSFLAQRYLNNGKVEKSLKLLEEDGAITKWKMIGTFDNDNGKGFYEKYPPENKLDFNENYKGKIAEAIWRDIPGVDSFKRIPLGQFFYPYLDTAAYLYTSIDAQGSIEALLSISAGDSIKVWLNGIEVTAQENIEFFAYENLIVKIELVKGINSLLIKSARRDGEWDLGVKLLDKNGNPFLNAEYLPNQITEKKEVKAKHETIFPFKKNNGEKLAARESILKGLLLEKSGFPKYAGEYYLSVFEQIPMNLLAKLFAAEAYLTAKEEGKYIDLLNLAILKTNSEVPGFLNRRGEFYSRKNQQERAEEDFKKALELNEDSMRAHLNLARLYRSKKWDVDSRRVLQAAIEKWGDSPLLILEMGATLERMGYQEDAAVYYNCAAFLLPGNSDLHLRVTDFKRRKNEKDAALKWGEKAFSFDRYNRNIYFRLFELSRQMKMYDESFQYLDKIESFAPDNAFIHRKRGDLFYEILMPEKALESWEMAYRYNPGDSYLSERIASLKLEEKDITVSFLPDEETVLSAVKRSLDFETHEGAESLLVLDHAACRINSDGSSRWVVTEVSRALNDTGRDNLINVFLPYGGRKKIINAYSLDKDLKKTEASSVSSYDVRFRQLKKGDFTVVQYIHYKPAPLYLENNFIGQWFVQSPFQHVIYTEWNLIYPQGKKLNIDVTGDRVSESVKKIDDNLIVHTFTAQNVEPLIHEYYSPPINDYLDTISVSTVESWDKYVSWERALLRDAFVSNAEIQKKYKQLTQNENTVKDKLESIFAFVAQEIRYQQEYENIIAGVKPHTAAQTLERGYGDCKDKAVLFIQLLNEGGIKAKYSVVKTTETGKLIKKIPGQQFNHAIVYIPKQEGIEKGFFMDPTVDLLEIGNLRNDNQGATALVLDHVSGEYKFKEIPYQSPEYNYQKHDRTFILDSSGKLSVTDKITLRGSLSSMLRQVLRTKEVAYNMFRNLASALFKGGVLEKYENSDIDDIHNPLTVTIIADANSLKTKHADKITISLPDQIVNPDLVSLENRKLPLLTGIPSIYEVDTQFIVPEGMNVESMPEDIAMKGNCFEISRSSSFEGNKLRISFVFKKECTIISVEDYSAYREQMLEIVKSQNALIVLSTDQ
jgi:cellulose synthase operon protein C